MQALMITRSCAIALCEPCQSLIAAALSKTCYVPQGCFVGDGYNLTTPVGVGKKACAVKKHFRSAPLAWGGSFIRTFVFFLAKKVLTKLLAS